jgi:cytochrome c biogenesis protein CcmG/thiol:disulfide interchange protein DsbE
MTKVDSTQAGPHESVAGHGRRLPLGFVVPVGLFLALAGLLGIGLGLDPGRVPSVLIGKPVPDFDLPPVEGRSLGLAKNDLLGEVSLVNVFASWCAECRREHPLLMDISARGLVPVHGLNYKDTPKDAKEWLDGLGDPYTRTGADIDGRVAIDFGVYGVPETFVIDQAGRIAHKHIGAMDARDLRETILPLIETLRRASP